MIYYKCVKQQIKQKKLGTFLTARLFTFFFPHKISKSTFLLRYFETFFNKFQILLQNSTSTYLNPYEYTYYYSTTTKIRILR